MAGKFPTELGLRPSQSPDLLQVDHQGDVSTAMGEIGHAVDHFGAVVEDMAELAAHKEGGDQAARDAAAGVVHPTGGTSIREQAYDQVANRFQASQQQAAMGEVMAKAFADNPDRPADLAKALDAARGGMAPTGNPQVDAEVAGRWALLRSDYMARAIQGARQQVDAQGKANFLTDLGTAQEALDQVAAGASIDAAGVQRVKFGSGNYIATLARYGPKTAFTVAGMEFKADDSRTDALNPAELEGFIQKGLSQSRKTWVVARAESLPTEAARRAFKDEVETRWKAGDPAFAGLDGADMTALTAHLEASADRLHAETRQTQYEAAQDVRNGIEAFTWGQDVDFDQLLGRARQAGDKGLEAQVLFYKDASPEVRGVLRSVVARSLGLLGNDGPGEVLVDAGGNPVAGGDPQAIAAEIRPDPAGYFGKIFGRQVEVTSGQRTPEQNARAGGVANSAHIPGLAWDLKVPGMSTAEVTAKLRQAGVPFDQVLDEHDHVHFGLGPKMRGQVLIRNGNAWSTPPDVKPGTPAYAAWASAREGFTTDPLNYARGGKTRPPIANVPILVPDGAFAGDAAGQAWGQAFSQRWSLGQAIAQRYGVPPRTLTNGERDYYKARVDADPMAGIQLARAARAAAGPQAAMRLMRELGESDFEASASLHIADLAAGGSALFARRAAQGMQLQAEGKAKLDDTDRANLEDAFEKARGVVPPPVWTAARTTAQAAMIADQLSGVTKPPSYYLNSSLGQTAVAGRHWGGPAEVNGRRTVLPRWLATDRAPDALQALGDLWHARDVGPVWANGQAVTGEQLGHMQPVLQVNGSYRFMNPRTGNPLMARSGRPFEVDLDQAKGFIAKSFGPAAVRPEPAGDN